MPPSPISAHKSKVMNISLGRFYLNHRAIVLKPKISMATGCLPYLHRKLQKMVTELRGPPESLAFNGSSALVHTALFSLSCVPWPERTSRAFQSRAIDFSLPQSRSTP